MLPLLPSEEFIDRTVEQELGPEVADDAEDVITCSIRFPDGLSVQRRFHMDDTLSSLFVFLRIKVNKYCQT